MPSRALYFDDESHKRTGAELQVALQQDGNYRCQGTNVILTLPRNPKSSADAA